MLSGDLKAGEDVDGIDPDVLDRVAAFHHEESRTANGGDSRADLREVAGREPELRDRVVLVGIDAEGYDQHVGGERRDLCAGIDQSRLVSVPGGAERQRIVVREPD